MCDYSTGFPTTVEQMIGYIKEGLEKIPHKCWRLLVSPSGSMLDEKEVPEKALEGILTLLKESPHEFFCFETRADSINEKKVIRCNELLENRLYRVFIGLESGNPWILKYCVNKMQSVEKFLEAHKTLKKQNVNTAANILISTPFLSVSENLKITIDTVKWAVTEGVNECFLFPVHVKEATPLLYLYNEGFFNPTSLWALVEVLKNLGPEISRRHLRLSWYTSYGAFNVVASPTTCEKCIDKVIPLLDRFAEFSDYEAIEKLINMNCTCKDRWIEQLHKPGTLSLPERVARGYESLARKFMGEEWWKENSQKILNELYEDANSSLYKNDFNGVCLER
jgi:radical SAM enzyme (TIGR01210 family)